MILQNHLASRFSGFILVSPRIETTHLQAQLMDHSSCLCQHKGWKDLEFEIWAEFVCFVTE